MSPESTAESVPPEDLYDPERVKAVIREISAYEAGLRPADIIFINTVTDKLNGHIVVPREDFVRLTIILRKFRRRL